MTKRKPKQTFFRDERGRFAHASAKTRAGLETMTTCVVHISPEDAAKFKREWEAAFGLPGGTLYVDRPKKIGWLERALTWFTWNRSKA